MTAALAGHVRHRRRPAGQPDGPWTPWQRNLVCFGALDLVGRLLVGEPGLRGVRYLAVGTGDAGWDTDPPGPDRSRTGLTGEVLRVPLVPGEHLMYDSTAGAVGVRVTLPAGPLLGHVLREVGLFGGHASPRPGSGLLLNHKPHDPIELAAGEVLDREIRLELPDGLLPGARDVIGGLLARRPGFSGLHHAAFGTDGTAAPTPPRGLLAEALRVPLDRRAVHYEAARHTVVAEVTIGPAQGPDGIAEAGLLGGPGEAGGEAGLLVDRQVFPAVDRQTPLGLRRRFELTLVSAGTVPVPDLTGQTPDGARTLLGPAGLLLGSRTDVVEDDATPGTVVGQDPAAGEPVVEGTAVAVRVAAVQTVVVPEVLGLPVLRAKAALRRLGLEVPAALDRQDHAAPGTVLACEPVPGTRVPAGARVQLVQAVRPQAAVPDVRGRSVTAARVFLEAAGFLLADPPYETVQSGSTAGGIVEQDPPAETLAPLGRRVSVVLATPWSAQVPDVTGLAPVEAAEALQAAAAPVLAALGLPPTPPGLALGGTARRPAGEGETVGTVVEQVPAAGTPAQLYATVAVVVATPSAVPVPDVVGLDQGSAAAALSQAGLALGAVARRVSERPTGLVVDQDPDAGRQWPPGGRVAVTISSPVTVVVPDLSGMDQAAAAEALRARELVLGGVSPEVPTEVVRPGSVIRQDPAAGQRVARGSQVQVVVAAGVPAVVGLPVQDAVAALHALGLVERVAEQPSDSAAGVVLAQDPAAGSPAQPGQVVVLTVAVPRRVRVPDVVGRPLPEATRAMTDLGLVLNVVDSRISDEIDKGAVLALDPPAGTLLQRGSGVAALLSLGAPVMVAVPRLVGLGTKEAALLCTELGLRLQVRAEVSAPGTPAGQVVRQDPVPNIRVVAGSTVLVDVARVDTSVAVPDVRGLPVSKAEAVLRAQGLGVQVREELSKAVPDGAVLSQDPVAGQRVPAGTTVRLVVARAGVLVPRVIGLALDAAVDRLEAAGLRLGGVSHRPGPGPTRVFTQAPEANTLVARGTGVSLTTLGGGVGGPLDDFGPVRPPIGRPPRLEP